MARGRKPHGRPQHLNPGRITRAGARALADQSPGSGFWHRSHGRKKSFPLFCEAMQTERRARTTWALSGVEVPHREVYPCRYGDHWLIETAPRHWHIGRGSDSL